MKLPTETREFRWNRNLMLAVCAASACEARQVIPPVTTDAVAPPGEPTVYETVPARLQRELDTAAKLDPDKASRMKAVRPTLQCVEQLSASKWRAHFGYENATPEDVSISVGFYNRFWPPPIGQGQPTALAPGAKPDVLKITFDGKSSAAWILGAAFRIADPTSPPCPEASSRGHGTSASRADAGVTGSGAPIAGSSVPGAPAPAAGTQASGTVGSQHHRRHRQHHQ